MSRQLGISLQLLRVLARRMGGVLSLSGLWQLWCIAYLMERQGVGVSETLVLLKEGLVQLAERQAEARSDTERPLPDWLY
ncbi:MAG: hypothetical protein RhofKO_17290 [Rhodothermales bacterium]